VANSATGMPTLGMGHSKNNSKGQKTLKMFSFSECSYIKILIKLFFIFFFFFPVPVCAITASGVAGDTFVSMNRFSTLCG
jgi:hypothetical protein